MNIYLNMLRAAGKLPVFDRANEGGGGGGDKAAEEAANAQADAAALKAAEEAAAKAKADADAAAEEAAKSGDVDARKLAEEKAELLKEVMDKKSKLKAAQEAEAEAKRRLDAYEGVDPDKVKELLRKEAEAEKAAAEARGDFERVKTMMAEEHSRATKSLQDKIAELEGLVTSHMSVIDKLTIGNDFGGSTFIRDGLVISPAKARALYGSHFEVKDGVTVAYDKPAGASGRTMMVDASGNPMSFDEAFKRIIDADPDSASLRRTQANPGGGSRSDGDAARDKKQEDKLYGASRIAASLN